MAFTLEMFPHVYIAKYTGESWDESFLEKEHRSFEEEQSMDSTAKEELLMKRNSFHSFPW